MSDLLWSGLGSRLESVLEIIMASGMSQQKPSRQQTSIGTLLRATALLFMKAIEADSALESRVCTALWEMGTLH